MAQGVGVLLWQKPVIRIVSGHLVAEGHFRVEVRFTDKLRFVVLGEVMGAFELTVAVVMLCAILLGVVGLDSGELFLGGLILHPLVHRSAKR